MMRALYTAASGMRAQQTNVDNISNNIANVNTTAFKSQKTEFKSLLYQTIQTRTTSANGEEKPIGAQVGLGTRVASNTTSYTQGALLEDESKSAFAIEGNGFFQVRGQMGQLTIPEMVILTGVLVRQEQPLPIPMDIRFWIPMETPLFFRIMSILGRR